MAKSIKYETVEELIFWSYSNLAMAHTAIERNQSKYSTFNYVIRAKLFKGLKDGTMSIRTIFDDEKVKLQTGQVCNYCGSEENLALDHVFAKKMGGEDSANNLLYACRRCNSSKGKKDLIEWMVSKGEFLPIMVIRRYLKLIYEYCKDNELLNEKIDDIDTSNLPFRLDLIPVKFSSPSKLKLNIVKRHDYEI